MTKANPTEDKLLVGNCLETLKTLDDASIDSIVTDPPYELGFMGKSWDASGIAYQVELWEQCLRVLKPGGHLLAFGGTRTYHRMAVAIEDAGFEIRDSIHWTYGSGFPKSLNISKAIDKAAKVERKVVGTQRTNVGMQGGNFTAGSKTADVPITAPATAAAAIKWDGWGTALKPSHEPIVVARKPLTGTVADTVLQHGTGGINIDATRIGRSAGDISTGGYGNGGIGMSEVGEGGDAGKGAEWVESTTGRFPANTLLTHNHDCDTTCTPNCPVDLLDQQQAEVSRFFHNSQWSVADDLTPFIYQAKPGKKERDAGLAELPEQEFVQFQTANGTSGKAPSLSEGRDTKYRNIHPTVKPVELIRYLIRMVTPPKGTVLDPFLGSGTTAVAAVLEGYAWKGCELTEDYLPIINGRVSWATREAKKKAKEVQLELPQ